MDKKKVYLQYPWKASECAYYTYLLTDPPENFEYITSKEDGGVIENKKKMMFYRKLKHFAKKILRSFKIVVPNTKKVNTSKEYNLIHGAHCMIKNNKPWVADFEYTSQLNFPMDKKRKEKAKDILIKDNCKKILPWTEWAKKDIVKKYPEIKDKVEVLYPGIPERNFKKKKHEGINLLFVSRFFYSKGGYHALEVMDRITKKNKDVKATLISQVPKEIKEKYEKNPNIKIYDLVPQKKLFEDIYPSADIFIYPGYIDTFGFPLTEAMSFGLPIVAVDTHSRKEIVMNNKTGFVVSAPDVPEIDQRGIKEKEEKIIQDMQEKTQELMSNEKLREKMSKAALKEIQEGRFSIKERNKKLKRIYGEALENEKISKETK